MSESEARELMTAQVGSAADLGRAPLWRIGRALAQLRQAARRAAAVRVDDDGLRHQAWLEANAAVNAANAARKAEPVNLARRLARQTTERRLETATDPIGSRTVTYGYDPASRQKAITRYLRPGQYPDHRLRHMTRAIGHMLKNGSGTQLAKIPYGQDKWHCSRVFHIRTRTPVGRHASAPRRPNQSR